MIFLLEIRSDLIQTPRRQQLIQCTWGYFFRRKTPFQPSHLFIILNKPLSPHLGQNTRNLRSCVSASSQLHKSVTRRFLRAIKKCFQEVFGRFSAEDSPNNKGTVIIMNVPTGRCLISRSAASRNQWVAPTWEADFPGDRADMRRWALCRDRLGRTTTYHRFIANAKHLQLIFYFVFFFLLSLLIYGSTFTITIPYGFLCHEKTPW